MDDLTEIRAAIQQLSAMVNQLGQQVRTITTSENETREAMNKLGAAQDWEYVAELKEWVSKKKLAELKATPR